MIPIEARKTIGPYQVLDVIGHGGMATVYRALEPQLDRIVAIKVLLPAFAEDAAFRSRFQREARLVARLKYPNIVGIYGVGEDQGMPYLAMEYLEGTTLHALIRQRRQAGDSFTPAEALDLLRPLAAALDYAHGEGIVHRDLKPENIILTTSGPVITDFGLAKMVADDAVTVSVIMGTPSYMAPEQIRGEMVDRRTDVYALGILLYELLTGQIPFTGPSPYAVVQAHLHLPPPALSNLNPRLASMPMLETVAQRAIAKGKPERWPTAGALVAALERAVDASTSETVRSPG
ncbi:MAG TPA: serine/threonine-protein kinase, partial [Herpetosiphonaceae bacterium]|nr:serine/threonine-protein kinase [Herpetosiphonaceae bacterium]